MDTAQIDYSKIPLVPPPPGVTPNLIDPPSLAPTILITGIVFLILATSFFLVRAYSKLWISRNWGMDDCEFLCFSRLLKDLSSSSLICISREEEEKKEC
jgi:hypothetical protein